MTQNTSAIVEKKKNKLEESVTIFIVNVDDESLKLNGTKFFERKVLGLSLSEILANEVVGFDTLFLQCKKNEEDAILSDLKKTFANKICVLFSDCPCISREMVENALNSSDKIVSFNKSFVADLEIIKKMENFKFLKEFAVTPKKEFIEINCEADFASVQQILSERIEKKLITRGVELQNCIIDFTSEIENGARLFGSTIVGESNVGKCIILGSVVDNSIIASGVEIENCVLKNCVICANVKGKKLENTSYMGEKS